jgi:hypothetical protein
MEFILPVFFFAVFVIALIAAGCLIFTDLHNDYKKLKKTQGSNKTNRLRVVK